MVRSSSGATDRWTQVLPRGAAKSASLKDVRSPVSPKSGQQPGFAPTSPIELKKSAEITKPARAAVLTEEQWEAEQTKILKTMMASNDVESAIAAVIEHNVPQFHTKFVLAALILAFELNRDSAWITCVELLRRISTSGQFEGGQNAIKDGLVELVNQLPDILIDIAANADVRLGEVLSSLVARGVISLENCVELFELVKPYKRSLPKVVGSFWQKMIESSGTESVRQMVFKSEFDPKSWFGDQVATVIKDYVRL